MRSLVFVTLLLAIIPSGSYAEGQIRVLSEKNGEILLEVTPFSSEIAPLPAARFFLAVPPNGSVTVDRIGGSFETRPIQPAELDEFATYKKHIGAAPAPGLYPQDPLYLSQPFTYRKTRVIGVVCYFRQLDKESGTARDWTGYRVLVRYPPAGRVESRPAADPLLASMVVNQNVFPGESKENLLGVGRPHRAGAVVDSAFSLSGNWIKIEIAERGMYTITGSDMVSSGVSLLSINDPSSFRLFTGGGFAQNRLLHDAGTWELGNWLREAAIYVEDGGDGTFGPTDRIIFYGLGAEDWQNYYDPSAPDTLYYVHPRAQKNYYYLTWDGSFPGSPARMVPRSAAPAAAPDRTTFRERYYAEKNLLRKFEFRGDGWLWTEILRAGPKNALLEYLEINDLVTSVPQEFRTVALAPYDPSIRDISGGDTVYVNRDHHAVYKASRLGTEYLIGEKVWDAATTDYYYRHGKPVRHTGQFLGEGSNAMVLEVPRDLNTKDWMYFAWYSLAYERRLSARNDRLKFSSPDTTGTVNFSCGGFSAGGSVYSFDVTDQFNVEVLENVEVTPQGATRRVRFAADLPGQQKHFWVSTTGGLESPALMRVYSPRDLRADAAGCNMLIVTHPSFRTAAGQLAAHRASNLPYYPSPRVNVVTTEEVYDNFSGGQPDPMAIRNYIKFLYDNFEDQYNNPKLAYVLLLGDATVDFKNYAGTRIDYVPTHLNMNPVTVRGKAYATDDWYAHLDVGDQPLDGQGRLIGGYAMCDVAIGRLCAASLGEVTALTAKVLGYEANSILGDWRNKFILVADDARGSCYERGFTDQSELIAYWHLPQYINVQKVYLAAFEDISGFKPESRLALLDMWNEGATVINYIGHGSSQQFADEQVFLAQDVSLLRNGFNLPIVMAFSCDVGDFANSSHQSLSERLLLRDGGGAIGTVTASELTLVGANEYLMYATIGRMLPRSTGPGVPMGEAMMLAKNAVQMEHGFSDGLEDNNWRYNLLCDPALRVLVPANDIRLLPQNPDTLVAGLRKTIRGAVYNNSDINTWFSGTVYVTVREPDNRDLFKTKEGCWFNFRYPGGTIYQGTAEVTGGEFEVSFRVPRYARTGIMSYLTAYGENGTIDAALSVDSLLTLVSPTLADSTLLRPSDGSPRVELGFKSGLKTVKPGESLRAVVRDRDGINILSSTNEGRHALLLDEALPIDVTEFFEFDHGGTDTSGVLTYPLPDLPIGDHRAIYKVSDSFGQTTLDTLRFAVTDSMDYFAEAVLNYPNPFRTNTQFLIHLSDRAHIRLDIFTVSGKRIRRLEEFRDGGREWIFWDGRDIAGDEIANGIYLYVVTVDFLDVERPPLVLRGKISKIE